MYYHKIEYSEKSRQFHSNFVGKNGKVLTSTEPMKRKASVIKNIISQLKGNNGSHTRVQDGFVSYDLYLNGSKKIIE